MNTDVEKLIEELDDAGPLKVDYAAWLHKNRATILAALRRLALAEKVVEAAREADGLAVYGIGSVCPIDALPHQKANSDRCVKEIRRINGAISVAIAAFDAATVTPADAHSPK